MFFPSVFYFSYFLSLYLSECYTPNRNTNSDKYTIGIKIEPKDPSPHELDDLLDSRRLERLRLKNEEKQIGEGLTFTQNFLANERQVLQSLLDSIEFSDVKPRKKKRKKTFRK